jgi:hypothetical protein
VLQLVYTGGIFLAYLVVLTLLLSIALVIDLMEIRKYFRELRGP